jgi:exonuclease SbcD
MPTPRPARILHTSDWHLGASFHGVDRSGDEQAALDELVRLCADEAIDGVVIAGDIFDTANPGAAELRRYYETLVRLGREGGVGTVVVIAGNHDSGVRLDGPRELMQACKVIVRGVLPAGAPVDDCLVPITGRAGGVVAWCAAIPYLREPDLDLPPGDEVLTTRQARAMQARCEAVLTAARTRTGGLPLVVAAHAFVRGGRLGGSERTVLGEVTEVTVGNLGQIEATYLGAGAAYVALGHLHRPQAIAGQEHWRYSGSLLPSGFDEIATGRSVVIATLAGPGPAAVRVVPLPQHRRYAALTGPLDEVRSAIAALPAAESGEPVPLLMATVQVAEARHGLAGEIEACAQQRGWRALRVVRTAVAVPGVVAAPAPTVIDIDEIRPLDVFRFAHRNRYAGNPPGAELEAAFTTLLADAIAGKDA